MRPNGDYFARLCSPSIVVLAAFVLFCGEAAKGQRYLTEDQRLYRNYHSQFLSKDREVIVALPAGYNSDSARRYPVLYMHDGNTVFTVWRLDETVAALVANNQMEPIIIVHVDNGGTQDDRFDLYTVSRDAHGRGGNANDS